MEHIQRNREVGPAWRMRISQRKGLLLEARQYLMDSTWTASTECFMSAGASSSTRR